jgi:hypothetical protein
MPTTTREATASGANNSMKRLMADPEARLAAAAESVGLRMDVVWWREVLAADPTIAADLALAAAAKEWYEQTQSLDALRSGATPTSDFLAILKAAKESDRE